MNKKSALRAIPRGIVKLENVSSTRVADCIVGAAAALSFAVHEVKEIRAELHSSGPGGGV